MSLNAMWTSVAAGSSPPNDVDVGTRTVQKLIRRNSLDRMRDLRSQLRGTEKLNFGGRFDQQFPAAPRTRRAKFPPSQSKPKIAVSSLPPFVRYRCRPNA